MKTTYEGVSLSVTTKKNATPEGKLLAGRLNVHKNAEKADFTEEEGAVVIYGEPKSKRIMQGRTCAVYWNPEKKQYLVRIRIDTGRKDPKLIAELDFEECMNFIGRRMANEK
ncbi:MAG: hypothetical protein IKP36_13720 [Bacteroidaceae bacterium]|nr:hypothetical protein [Bacteroidaceae bacterium]